MNKVCRLCRLPKDTSEFNKSKNSKDGLDGRCHECYIAYRKKNYIKTRELRRQYALKIKKERPWGMLYYQIKYRCDNPKSPNYRKYGAKGRKCLITLEELKYLWFRDKAYELKHPSIDRIDNNGSYELNNCRFIEKLENSRLGSMIYSQSRSKSAYAQSRGKK